MSAHASAARQLARGEALEIVSALLRRLAESKLIDLDVGHMIRQGAAIGAFSVAYGCTYPMAGLAVIEAQRNVYLDLAEAIERLREAGTDDLIAAFVAAHREVGMASAPPDLNIPLDLMGEFK
jgi:hypothetical protein